MKPFSIKEHLEHPDWKVATREGEPVRILCTDLNDNNYPVVAVINKWHVDKFTADGIFQAGEETKYDLFFATKKREGWVNIYKNTNGNSCVGDSRIFESKEDAEKEGKAWKTYIGTTKIEWEE